MPISRLGCALTLCALLRACPLKAQRPNAQRPGAPQTPAQPPQTPAQAEQPKANPPQEPGAGAQLRTGTSIGVDLDTRLQDLLANHQFAGIQAELANLPPREARFYRGILANHDNDSAASIELLEPLAAEVTAGGNFAQMVELRQSLAQDYLRLGDWAKAAGAYWTLATDLKGHLSTDEQDEIEMPLRLLPLAKSDPPMTVDPCDSFSIQASMDPLGLTDIPVFVDARPHTWMLDPTLPFNLISYSLAREAGLTISNAAATIHTLTGRPIQVRSAVVPRFTIGGVLTLRNMTVFVYNDADYYFPYTHYQVEGVLGYPALEAMGSLTVTDEDMIYIRPSKQPDPADATTGKPTSGVAAKRDAAPSPSANTGVPFYLDGDQIVVALGKAEDAAGADAAAPPRSSACTPWTQAASRLT
ncbi:MAG: retropepsin-like aspartic protease [Terracidiphilus sp.]